MKSSLQISTNYSDPQPLQTFSAPVVQEPTRAANPHLDFTGGYAKWRFDNSNLLNLTN